MAFGSTDTFLSIRSSTSPYPFISSSGCLVGEKSRSGAFVTKAECTEAQIENIRVLRLIIQHFLAYKHA